MTTTATRKTTKPAPASEPEGARYECPEHGLTIVLPAGATADDEAGYERAVEEHEEYHWSLEEYAVNGDHPEWCTRDEAPGELHVSTANVYPGRGLGEGQRIDVQIVAPADTSRDSRLTLTLPQGDLYEMTVDDLATLGLWLVEEARACRRAIAREAAVLPDAGTRMPSDRIYDACPAWCVEPEERGCGGDHPDALHVACVGRAGAPDAPASILDVQDVYVELEAPNRHGLPQGPGSRVERVVMRHGGDDASQIPVTPTMARTLARLLTVAADRLELWPAFRAGA